MGEIRTEEVRAAELRAICDAQGIGEGEREQKARELMGLALSGGGIRSATFNLGVLQAFARFGLLKEFDYLSTVSGGGYIGSWLSAWAARKDWSIKTVEAALASEREEPKEVKFLREYSNYLTPRVGWLSIDTLTGAATYVRNMLLNLTIIVCVVGALLLLPWLVGKTGLAVPPFWLLCASFLPLGCAAWFITRNVVWQEIEEYDRAQRGSGDAERPPPPPYARAEKITWLIVLPLVLWACAMSIAVVRDPHLMSEAAIGMIAIALAAGAAIARVLCRQATVRGRAEFAGWVERPARRLVGMTIGRVGGIFIGAVIGVWLLVRAASLVPSAGAIWHAAVWGVPAVLVIFLLAVTVMLGLTGRDESEYGREWWSRLGGLLIRVALVWAAFFAASIYGPWLLWQLGAWVKELSAAWLLTTLGAVLSAKSPATGDDGKARWLDLLAKIGPYVFICGLLLGVATAAFLVIVEGQVEEPIACTLRTLYGECDLSDYFRMLERIALSACVAIPLLAFIAALGSGTVDINLFSFHMFYRNRLARCYLGASNPKWAGFPFIGFDPRDNRNLTELRRHPYHIVNTALNLTSSERLGWQERRAGSFILAPEYCGYEFPIGPSGTASKPAYRCTDGFAGEVGGRLNLATALTISGAAVNPNMGYHSSPSVAFLLSVFNVRLGWWMQNPRHAAYWRKGGPHFGLRYLLSELLGLSSEETKFVNLSDGGHFDNLGVYELVRRRCRFIVASDAAADGKFTFEDLGNAIRKCRVDLGIDIEIDKRAMLPDAAGRSRHYCAVGRIRYDRQDPGLTPGYLVYIKSSLTGGEPTDVLQYKASCPAFPHESTADQWFSESQFESYRRLGLHAAHTVLEGAGVKPVAAGAALGVDREAVFVALKDRWFPPASAGSAAFSKHGAELKRLEEALRTDDKLRFLDWQLYPEWKTLDAGRKATPEKEGTRWLPAAYDELRSGFHFCNNMLQLMENVYGELNLEEEHDHPDHRGWMSLFRHWSWSGMFISTYAVCASMYGARFQRFCARRLDLRPGRLRVSAPNLRKDSNYAATKASLNFVEQEIVTRLEAAELPFDRLYLLQSAVWSPDVLHREPPAAPTLVYTLGFALAQGDTLLYLRVQDHLRVMGYGRRALSRLYHRSGVTKCDVGTAQRLPGMKWIEQQDFPALARLFESVRLQPQDIEDVERAAVMTERAGDGPEKPK